MTKFKVGDWVRSTKYSHMRPAKITSIYESNEREGDFGLKCDGTVHYASEAELWQPKEGEWVWSQVGECNTPTIIKVTKQHIDESWLTRDNCEPFNGELPTFLRRSDD